MVICKYYLTNSCNFGNQCKNEHINVATVVKADAEAAVKGKQWILSSYGPFKDKPCLPNFEDQSFEEIRYLCYEAKNNGTIQTLLPQLSQQAADASYKISMLCDVNNINNNLLNILVNLYNSGESTGNNPSTLNSGNPFAVASGVGVSNSPATSLFGTSTTAQQQNPFGGGSLFGTAASTTPASSSSLFGSAALGTTTTNNFFGQQSTFGGGGGTTAFGGQSTFGGGNNSAFGASTFGQTPSSSPFALSQIGQSTEPAKQSSIFGASQFQQTQNSIFGAAPAFGNQIQPAKSSGLFSSASASIFGQSQNPTPSGLFGQATATNQPANSGNLFASFGASPQTQQTPFGATPQTQQTPFGATPQNQQTPFGAAPQTQPPQGLFGTATDNKSIFGQSTNSNQNVFGSSQPQINQNSNIFANALVQQQNNSQNVFGVQQQPEQQSIFNQSNSGAPASNIFQNQSNAPAMGGSVFGGGGGAFGQAEQVSQSVFSKLEELTPEDLEWFRADRFDLAKIPTVPPPRELCV